MDPMDDRRWTSSSSSRPASATPRTCSRAGGEAVLVDPQRDAWRFLEVAERRGWRIRHVLETHVHNDYLSGALETRAATGAEIAAPARGGYEFEHRPVDEGDCDRDRRPAADGLGDAGPHAGAPRVARRRRQGRPARARTTAHGDLHRRQPARRVGRADGPARAGR